MLDSYFTKLLHRKPTSIRPCLMKMELRRLDRRSWAQMPTSNTRFKTGWCLGVTERNKWIWQKNIYIFILSSHNHKTVTLLSGHTFLVFPLFFKSLLTDRLDCVYANIPELRAALLSQHEHMMVHRSYQMNNVCMQHNILWSDKMM